MYSNNFCCGNTKIIKFGNKNPIFYFVCKKHFEDKCNDDNYDFNIVSLHYYKKYLLLQ